jgi:hypothetical protein
VCTANPTYTAGHTAASYADDVSVGVRRMPLTRRLLRLLRRCYGRQERRRNHAAAAPIYNGNPRILAVLLDFGVGSPAGKRRFDHVVS